MRLGHWVCILVLVLAGLPPYGSPASISSLTLQRAAELATQRKPSEALDSVDRLADLSVCFKPLKSFAHMQPFTDPTGDTWATGLLMQPVLESMPGGLRRSGEQEARLSRRSYNRDEVVLCTVNAYLELIIVAAQLRVLDRQESAANRLVRIEKLRIHEKVDDAAALTRGKLQLARARLWGAELRNSDRTLRKRLAELTGITEENMELSPGSVPSFPRVAMISPVVTEPVRQNLLARDVAQLQYALARNNRQKRQVRLAQGSTGIGELISAYVEEQERLNMLLQAESDYLRARVHSLFVTGQLDDWVTQQSTDATHSAREKSLSGLSSTTPVETLDSEKTRNFRSSRS